MNALLSIAFAGVVILGPVFLIILSSFEVQFFWSSEKASAVFFLGLFIWLLWLTTTLISTVKILTTPSISASEVNSPPFIPIIIALVLFSILYHSHEENFISLWKKCNSFIKDDREN